MSTDRKVTENIIEILEDGKAGFEHAADMLRDSNRADLAPKFVTYSTQRAAFSEELEKMAATYGDDIDQSGSVKATIHRAWMSVRDTLSGDDPDGVLDAAEQGEDKAIEAYQEALGEEISADLRTTLQRQYTDIQAAHREVKALRNTNS